MGVIKALYLLGSFRHDAIIETRVYDHGVSSYCVNLINGNNYKNTIETIPYWDHLISRF